MGLQACERKGFTTDQHGLTLILILKTQALPKAAPFAWREHDLKGHGFSLYRKGLLPSVILSAGRAIPRNGSVRPKSKDPENVSRSHAA
jgi:hypothetical protein